MSTSLLYHRFGIRGYQYTRTDYQNGQTIFTIHQAPETCHCSACGSPQVQSRGRVERRFRTVPIGSHATFVVLPIPRVECQACGVVRQVKVAFADVRRSYTSSFERYALTWSPHDHPGRGEHLGVADVIKDIQKRDLHAVSPSPSSSTCGTSPSTTAIAKGHRYPTVVADLERSWSRRRR
jgi:transposase